MLRRSGLKICNVSWIAGLGLAVHIAAKWTRSLWRCVLFHSAEPHLEGLRNIDEVLDASIPAAAKPFRCCAKTFNW